VRRERKGEVATEVEVRDESGAVVCAGASAGSFGAGWPESWSVAPEGVPETAGGSIDPRTARGHPQERSRVVTDRRVDLLGIALEHLSFRVTLLIFGVAVGLGVLASARFRVCPGGRGLGTRGRDTHPVTAMCRGFGARLKDAPRRTPWGRGEFASVRSGGCTKPGIDAI
jgi:hypothetical protein